MQTRLEELKMAELRQLAKDNELRGWSSLKKADLIVFLKENLKSVEEKKPPKKERKESAPRVQQKKAPETPKLPKETKEDSKKEDRPEEPKKKAPKEMAFRDGADQVDGFLEIVDGKDFGFLRFHNFSSSEEDVYVSPNFIRLFNLKTGDKIQGDAKRNQDNDRFRALIYIREVNNDNPSKSIHRQRFSDMTPIHPKERLLLENSRIELSTRLIDLVSPVGKGQRGLIVAPPKAGKTILLQNIAKSIEKNHPEVIVMVLLIDERPEEVTEMKRSIHSDVISSTFDELPSNHLRVADLVLQRAMGLAEMGKDVVILLDSITRLARAFNLETAPSGRTLSGGLDPAALHGPKRFFGAARCLEEGGSITILATALIETGSRMDEVIFEEFKGTGNMELVLTRTLSERRIFPAIDISRSGTRREERLLSKKELEFVWKLRRNFSERDQATLLEEIIHDMLHTTNNDEFMDVFSLGW